MAVSMSCAEATPSCTMRMASSAMATPRRLLANPGESCTVIAVLPSAVTQPRACSTRSSPVCSPTTTSTRSLAGTGLKKCSPMNRSGAFKPAAMPLTDRELVLVASTAPMRPPPRTPTTSGRSAGAESVTSVWSCAVMSGPLDQECGALAHADAQGRQTAATSFALEPAEQGEQDAGARGAERVAERDGTAVGVDDLL